MLLWLSVIAFPVGCGQPQMLATNQSGNETTQDSGVGSLERIDLGVVFADQASYVCFPLSYFGIESAEQIVELQSSCHCAVPSIVTYRSPSGPTEALRIDFEPEVNATETFDPSLLSLEISIQVQNRQTKRFTIDLFHTLEIGGGSATPASADTSRLQRPK